MEDNKVEEKVEEMTERDIEYINQNICSLFVNREVIINLCNTIELLVNSPDHDDHSRLEDLSTSYDYEEAAREENWIEVDEMTVDHVPIKDVYDDIDSYLDDLETFKEEHDESYFFNTESKQFSDARSWEQLCFNKDINYHDYHQEVYEYWAVTNFLRRKLEEQGELTAELLDFSVWGRTCTGQAIAMDGVIRSICDGMQILYGQPHSWEKQV